MNYRKGGLIFLCALLISAAAFFLFRNALLRIAMEHYQQKIKDQYGASFHISHAAFAGLKTIRLDTLELITLPPYPLLTCDRMGLRVSLFSLLKGQIPFSRIRISNLHVSLQQNDSTSNYKVFFQKRSPLKETSAGNEMKPGYGTMLNSLDIIQIKFL